MFHKIILCFIILRKLYILLNRKYMWWINLMDKIEKINSPIDKEDDFGYMLWKLESVENFFPCYKTMLKKGD